MLEKRFRLAYGQHGGSQLLVPWLDTLELDYAELEWLLERLEEERDREAAALKKK